MLHITLYACVYGALPAFLDRRGERFKGIQTLFHTVQLILLCVFTATVIALGTTLIGSINYQAEIPHYQRYVKTFLQEFFGGYSVSFVYLSLASTFKHIQRKMDFKNPHAQTQPFPIHFSKSNLIEGGSLIIVLVLGVLFIQSLPERRLLNYAILILLPTTWLAFRFGTTGTMLALPIVMILAQMAQIFGQLDLIPTFELQVACSIYTIMLTMLGTTVLVQRRSDLHLTASRNKFDLLAESSPVGICQINQHREIEYTNPRWIELTGLNTDRTYGADFLDFIHPTDHAEIIQALQCVQKSHHPKELTFPCAETGS